MPLRFMMSRWGDRRLDRFNQIDYQIQLGRLTALCDRFNPAAVIAESTSIGAAAN